MINFVYSLNTRPCDNVHPYIDTNNGDNGDQEFQGYGECFFLDANHINYGKPVINLLNLPILS